MKKSNLKFVHIVGARPNFVKAFPLIKYLNEDDDMTQVLIHTGQHYDYQMSQSFFDTFEIKKPNYFLDIGHHDPIIQIGKIVEKMYKILIAEKPDLVIVYGDVNSTVGATVIAKRLNIDVVHVEAGLRSFDMDMPEEINRLIVDKLSDLLLIHSESAKENLMPMQQGDVLETHADIDELIHDIDFKPSVSIEEGIGKFVHWYEEIGKHLDDN